METVSTPGVSSPLWLRRVMLGGMFVFLGSSYFSIAVNSLSIGLMAVSWCAIVVWERRCIVKRTALDYFFLAYIAAELLATAFSVNPAQSLFFSRRVLLIGIVYFFTTWVSTEGLAKWIIGVLLGTATVVALLGVVKLLVLPAEQTTRLGIFQFYMTTAELMMIAALLLLPFCVHPRTPRAIRGTALLALIPVLVSLYATVTRGAYVAVAAGALFIALVRSRKLVFPLLVVVVLLIVFAPPYVESRLHSIIDIHHPENASRLMLWTIGLRIFADHPVVGVGDIDLGELFRKYADPGSQILWGHLHNVPLQFLVTLGAVGFVVVVVMFVKIFVVQWKIYRRSREDWFVSSVAMGSMALFVGFQTNGLFEWSFGDQEVATLFWAMVGMTLATGSLSRETTSVE